MRHESEFLQIQAALKPFDSKRYLRLLNTDAEPTADTRHALSLIDQIVEHLEKAYDLAGNELLAHSSVPIAEARAAMYDLLKEGEKLAARKIGIPFFHRWGGTDPGPPARASGA